MKRLPILGSDAFIKTVSEKYLKDKNISHEIVEHKCLQKLPSVSKVISLVADYYHVDIESLKKIERCRSNEPRAIAIYLACQLTGQSLQFIADQFTNISYSGVAQTFKRMKQKITEVSNLAKAVVVLENKLRNEIS